jgi:hypothetical protein
MISVDVLLQRFGPALDVKPWGECIVVQGSEFDPDWEAELGDLGFRCHFGSLDGHAVTFVQLKKAVAPGKTVYVPPAVIKEVPIHEVQKVENKVANEESKHVSWRPEEDVFLIELWNQGLSIPEIELMVRRSYPGRIGNAANMRLKRLRFSGKIQPRQKRVSGNGEVKKMEKAKFGSGCQKGPDWSESQVALLLAKWADPKSDLKSLTKEERSVELAKWPEFAGRSAASIYQKACKLQKPKTSKEAKKSLAEPEKAPTVAEPKPKWNGEFGEKCTLPIDCIHCNITECPGRKSESKTDTADILVDLVKTVQVLSEAYDSLNKAYAAVKADFEAYANMTSEISEAHREDLKVLTAKCAMLQKEITRHKHAVSGEAMLPLEAVA